jgi:hypothetical protein
LIAPRTIVINEPTGGNTPSGMALATFPAKRGAACPRHVGRIAVRQPAPAAAACPTPSPKEVP